MIPVGPEGRAPVEAFLRGRLTEAMFPLANLLAHGMAGGHPRATRFWADDPAAPGAVLGLTEEGMVLPVWNADWDAGQAVEHVARHALMGFAGASHAVRPLMAALAPLPAAHLDEDEPQFDLSLDRLAVPDGPGGLVPLARFRDAAIAWRLAYLRELHMGAGTPREAADSVDAWIRADSHRILEIDGRPAALTGFNAALPEIVQVGGVYTPFETRGRGLAGRAVALHLAEARAAGVARATLFAASPAAVRVYAKLCFRRIGAFALVLLDRDGA